MSTQEDPSPPTTNPDLESFREQWRAEVRARNPAGSSSVQQPQPHRHRHRATSSVAVVTGGEPRTQPPPPTHKAPVLRDYEDDYVQPRSFDDEVVAGEEGGGGLKGGVVGGGGEPVSALEHYEKAVERESAGSLGDSLRLYRKAFRMDDRVDQQYKSKHFPKAAVKAPPAAGEGVAAASDAPVKPLTIKEFIASFAGLAIEPAPPEVEGTPEPPCPIASLPDEIMVHILRDVAVQDVGDYVRLARVCKRLAYLIATEDRIWRRVCLGPEWGFGGMHYHWQMGISWEPFKMEDLLREAETEIKAREQAQIDAGESSDEEDVDEPPMILTVGERSEKHAQESTATTLALFRSPVYNSSWQRMFRLRPRIRFGGCYISTANYHRPGQAASTQYTWASPVHIVTYYRYLRFFRDGSVLSLLTTTEPADVVHHLTKEKAALHVKGANPHLPSSVMQSALRGRWRLVGVDEKGVTVPVKAATGGKYHHHHPSPTDIEGDVVVETEGVVSKYIYRMDLSLRSSGGGGGKGGMPRNNKLVWRGFYSYDRVTDDWAEFGLRNDKPFFFSRVGSYGVGGE